MTTTTGVRTAEAAGAADHVSAALRPKIALALLGATALVYMLTAPGHLGTVDMRAEFAVAQSMVGKADFTVSPSLPYVTVPYVVGPDGAHYSAHGLGQSLLLVPAALIGRIAGCGDPASCPATAQHDAEFAASFTDGIAAAVAVMLMFLLALDLGAAVGPALALSLLFGFTTIEWAYAHDAFDVGPTTTVLLLTLFAVHRGLRESSARWLIVGGAATGLAVALRFPSLVCVPIFAAYVIGSTWRLGAVWLRRRVVAFGAPLAAAFLLLGWYNWIRFGDPLQSGYSLASDYYGFGGSPLSGVAGLLFSPGRSILLYSPILIAALAGLPLLWRRHRALTATVVAIVVVNLGFYGAYLHWWGDWGWGPRFLVPITPLLILPLLPLLSRWGSLPRAARRSIYGLAAAGVVIQLLDIGVEFQHQIQLLREAGVEPPDAQWWTPQYSGIWRHGEAMLGLVNGSAAYPSTYQFTDLSTAVPLRTVFDFWWVYAWIDGVNPLVVVTVVMGAIAGVVALAIWLRRAVAVIPSGGRARPPRRAAAGRRLRGLRPVGIGLGHLTFLGLAHPKLWAPLAQIIRPLVRRPVAPAAGALLLYVFGAMLLSLSAWQSPATTYIGGCCDPEQAMWYLRWGPYAISHLSDPFFTQQLNAPAGVNLMWFGSSLIVSVVASPITLLFGPIVAYNVVITAAMALSAWCAFLALRRYAHGIVGPLIGGAVYGFSPYVVPQATQHMQLAVAFVPPLFLLVLDELLRRRRRSLLLGAALGILAFIQFLTAEELVLTSAILGGVMVAVLAVQRRQEIRATLRPLAYALVAALLTFSVLVAWPIAAQFLGPQQLHGVLHNADTFSTDALNLVVPTKFQLVSPDAATAISTHFSGFDWEANAYIGFLLLILLAAFTARHWSEIRVRTAAIVGMVALVFSLGPHLEIAGQSTGWPLPEWPLAQLPVVGDMQPNRIAIFMWLAIAVLVTIAIDGALSRRWRHAAPRLGAIALALATVLPAPLPASTVAVPAFFQNWQQEGIPDGTTMLVAPFVNGGAAVDPMLWAAVAGDGFRMPEAYAAIPQADGTTAYGPIPTELASAMQNIQYSGATIAVRGDVRDQIGRDLQAGGVSDVVVGPMNNRAQMVAFFTDLFGRPPGVVDGVELWRDVDSAGVVPA